VGILGTLIFKQPSILPSNQNPLGALPARFRRERVLIVGCGDVGLRVARQLGPRVQVLALTSQAARVPELRALGIRAVVGNLDRPATLARMSGLATRVIHLAPPPSEGWSDSRTNALVRALRLRQSPVCTVYGSTSGVYGDCFGDWVSETRTVNPHTPRAHRRVDAENRIRFWGRSASTRVSILRIPGIYAQDRDSGTPRARLLKAVPVLRDEDDVYTNHIHADDLARACCLALWRGAPQRTYNINDETCLKMGDYFDLAADLFDLPRPPRIARSAATDQLPLMLLSFMSESRRMNNTRMKRELGLRLGYPTVRDGLALSAAAPPRLG
jgi:nucleoside-diphosphate-sugar epimerase